MESFPCELRLKHYPWRRGFEGSINYLREQCPSDNNTIELTDYISNLNNWIFEGDTYINVNAWGLNVLVNLGDFPSSNARAAFFYEPTRKNTHI
jgi:hypothetical protein